MKRFFLISLLSVSALAQTTPSTKNVTKATGTNALTEDFTVPSGRTVTFQAGSTLSVPGDFIPQSAITYLSSDLSSRPLRSELHSVAFSGQYSDLIGLPPYFSGSYNDLENLPTFATVATSGSAADLTGTLADDRLSANVPLKNTANTFTAAQTAPSWRLPAYAGSVTIPADAYGMGWDENGRFTLQSPVGALQLYAVGSPSVPTIYWPGNIVAQTMTSSAMTTTIAANYITAGDAGNSGLNGTVLDNSLLSPMREWQGTFTRAGANGIPTGTDAQGTGSSLEFLDGTYWPQASVTGASTTTSTIVGRYRTSAQAKADLAIAPADLAQSGASTGQAIVWSGTSWAPATVSGGGGVSDGDKGDITVSGTGTVWTIDANAVTLADLAQVATATILGRTTAGTGNVEALTAAQGRSVLGVDGGTITPATVQISTELQLPAAAPGSPSAGDIYRNANTIRYRDSTNAERLLLNATDNLANLSNIATARTNLGLGTLATASTVTSSQISDSTTAGRALLTAADAAAQRTSLGIGDSVTYNYADSFSLFGDGNDGTVTISTGTTSLLRDMFYDTLTITGGQIQTNGYRIFCRTLLDLSSAPADAIVYRNSATGSGNAGATSGTAGSASGSMGASTVGGGFTGVAGGAGGATTGTAGTAAATQTTWGYTTSVRGGAGGAGGAGSSGAGGSAGTTTIANTHQERFLSLNTLRGATLLSSGSAGAGGGGGGGDGTSGAGGGSGASSGGVVVIAAKTIARGTNTNTSIISSKGRNGGAGGSATAGNRGGGGGGGGSSGGYIRLIYASLTGSTITGALDVTGGTGGNGGAGFGTGVGGGGGDSGSGGIVELWNIGSGTHTVYQGGAFVAGGAASGITGGTGATATTSRTNL